MPPSTLVILALAIIVVVIAVLLATRRARTQRLRDRFGAEYDRTVRKQGSAERGEAELAARSERHASLDIQPLSSGARSRYAEEWRVQQLRFTDEPAAAVAAAQALVTNVMRDRGYPTDDFAQNVSDVSVEHARVVDDYRAAHAIAQRSERGAVDTEALRQAMIHYRALFSDLLGAEPTVGKDDR